MTKSYYHATPSENLESILSKGIHVGFDNVVYLADTAIDATKFLYIRGYRDILVIEVDLEEDSVSESYDHNEKFFGCKAYIYDQDIPNYCITEIFKYELD